MRMLLTVSRLAAMAGLLALNVVIAFAQTSSLQCPDQLVGLRSTIWKTIEIPVCWETMDSYYGTERQWVRQATVETWEKNSALRFTGWGACQLNSRGIRIGVGDINPHTKGLGNQLNGSTNGMMLNFVFQRWSPRCAEPDRKEYCIKNIAVHEFGHALGFAHEQNRADSPDWCQAEKQGTSGDIYITPFDMESVMNYCNPKWGGDGNLSALDIKGLQAWYGRPKLPLNRYDGRWKGNLTYSDPGCVADAVEVNISGTSVNGTMSTPDGRRVAVQASLDDAGQLKGFQMRLSPKDTITLRGSLTEGTLNSTDCGCGSYNFRRTQ
jgi:hypothetical protein